MEKEGFKIKLQKEPVTNGQPLLAAPIAIAPALTSPSAGAGGAGAPATPAPSGPPMREIVSPMVGTFYRSPGPDSPPFVDVGAIVTEDTVVGIIEAMKVMNEIKAEASGTIAEVVAENAKPVQFGQALFRLR
jgi:acetyl-CoA carboxylase biotin carboxyl carrier protein